MGFREVDFLSRLIAVVMQDVRKGGDAVRSELEKKITVICEEEMRDFWAISDQRDSFDVLIIECVIKIRGEDLGANGEKEGGEGITLSKTTAWFERGSGSTVDKDRILDSGDTLFDEINPMLWKATFEETFF